MLNSRCCHCKMHDVSHRFVTRRAFKVCVRNIQCVPNGCPDPSAFTTTRGVIWNKIRLRKEKDGAINIPEVHFFSRAVSFPPPPIISFLSSSFFSLLQPFLFFLSLSYPSTKHRKWSSPLSLVTPVSVSTVP